MIGEYISLYSKFGALDLIPVNGFDSWTSEDIRCKETTVREASNRVKNFMPAQQSRFYGSKLTSLSKFDQQNIKEHLNKIDQLSDLFLTHVRDYLNFIIGESLCGS
jgi:hypothetical protein